MTTSSQNILDSFDQLPESEKQRVASEIIRRTIKLNLPALSDDELVLSAEGLFLELDKKASAAE